MLPAVAYTYGMEKSTEKVKRKGYRIYFTEAGRACTGDGLRTTHVQLQDTAEDGAVELIQGDVWVSLRYRNNVRQAVSVPVHAVASVVPIEE